MSAEIININDRKKKQEPPAPDISVRDLAHYCSDCIEEDWERAAKKNRLQEFFVQSTQPHSSPSCSYLADLNAISAVEAAFNMRVFVRSPDDEEPIGWVAGFKIGDDMFSTIEMFTEPYARCFNILLFLKLKREMKSRGM